MQPVNAVNAPQVMGVQNSAAPRAPYATPVQLPASTRHKPKGRKIGHDAVSKLPDSPPEWRQGSLLPPAPGPRTKSDEKNAISPTLQPFSPFAPNAAEQLAPPKGVHAPSKPAIRPTQAPNLGAHMTGQHKQRSPQTDPIHGLDRYTQPKKGIKAPRAKDTGQSVPLRPLKQDQNEAAKNQVNSYGPAPSALQ
jgi:hypothetical protein